MQETKRKMDEFTVLMKADKLLAQISTAEAARVVDYLWRKYTYVQFTGTIPQPPFVVTSGTHGNLT